jgi:hypothetical protein
MLRTLKQFKQREGHLRVQKRQVEDGLKLGDWVCFHRAKQKAANVATQNPHLNLCFNRSSFTKQALVVAV